MGTIIVSFMTLGLSLPIILSRSCLPGLFRDGVLSKFSFHWETFRDCVVYTVHLTNFVRCTTYADNLDAAISGRRTRALADLLCSSFSSDMLWDEYGIDN